MRLRRSGEGNPAATNRNSSCHCFKETVGASIHLWRSWMFRKIWGVVHLWYLCLTFPCAHQRDSIHKISIESSGRESAGGELWSTARVCWNIWSVFLTEIKTNLNGWLASQNHLRHWNITKLLLFFRHQKKRRTLVFCYPSSASHPVTRIKFGDFSFQQTLDCHRYHIEVSAVQLGDKAAKPNLYSRQNRYLKENMIFHSP